MSPQVLELVAFNDLHDHAKCELALCEQTTLIVAFVPPAPKLPGVAVPEGNAVAQPAPPEPEAPAESGEMPINVVPIAAEPRLPSQPPPEGPPAEPDRAVNE